MIAGEMIDGYNCSACKKKVTIEKKQTIKNLPNTLIVHLNRIVFDFESMRNVKLNDKLEFPNQLNMRQYMLHQVLADMKKNDQQQKASAQDMAANEDAKLDQEEVRGANPAQAQANEDAGDNDEENKAEDEAERAAREEENRKLAELIKEGQKASDSSFDYKLVGVVIHMGIADAGHYLSYVNIEREGQASDDRTEWMRTDK